MDEQFVSAINGKSVQEIITKMGEIMSVLKETSPDEYKYIIISLKE